MKENQAATLFAEERRAEIVKLVNRSKKVLVPDLIESFKVSPATIRNDLRELEALGLIKRTHGGAIPADYIKPGFEPDSAAKNVAQLEAKRAIARKAVELVEDGDIIILDTGTTTLEMAKLLDGRSVTVIVNDIELASCLERFESVNLILIGGTVRRNFHCTTGPFATHLLAELSVDKAFMGTNAFSLRKGCTTPDIGMAEIKRIMAQIATQVIVLCDSSKIDKNSFIQFLRPHDINAFITDGRIAPKLLDDISEEGIEVHIAEDAT